jgi:hypothetical protein
MAIAFSVINILLAWWGQNDLIVYYIVDCIVYLIILLAFINLNSRTRVVLYRFSAVLLVGFLVIISAKVIEILK